ncbi:MAG: molybdopterin-dependent oxidoreductase [Desulfobacteraceae bacterium]|nr:molybdopterin-dependent oxidoreductase [Desulfobacteraceae bacterium]
MKRTKNIFTLCRMCDQGCGLEVTVEDGQPVRIQGSRNHPYNKGWLCAKGRAGLDFFYSPQRLSSPLIRREGELVPVEWEEALDFAAERLGRMRDQYGPESVAIYRGEGTGHQEIKYYMKRFANVLGTPNFIGVGSLCHFSKTLSEQLTYGAGTGPDIANTRFLMIWGGNPFFSHEPVVPREISRLKKSGGKIAVVDPRRTETASKADHHLAVKPGRDEILTLNMLHVILREDLWDKSFTDKWVPGFHGFSEKVREDRFSPENGEFMTGIMPDLVRQVARSYATTRPACIYLGNGLEHHSHGVNTMRLLAIMKAITGNLDVRGGDIITPEPNLRDMTMPLPQPSISPVGSEEFPLFCKMRKEGHVLAVPEAILEGRPYPIKGMIIGGGNASLEWPNSIRVREALKKLEFLLVIDVVRSPDCAYADVVLPACTYLERDEHRVNADHCFHHISLRRRVVEPVYGLPDQMIWARLAKHMGFEEYFPWKTCQEGIDYLLGDEGVSYEGLISQGGIYEYGKREYKKYEQKGFRTPTGKVEIDSERLKAFGYDPFPIREDVLEPFQESGEFPLFLTTGANLLCYVHWQYRYVPRLRKMFPEPVFEIHPETAAQYGLSEGEMAEVHTTHGRIQLRAHVTPRIRQDTINIPQGWEEANANELTGTQDADPISGFPNLKSLRCRIRKMK